MFLCFLEEILATEVPGFENHPLLFVEGLGPGHARRDRFTNNHPLNVQSLRYRARSFASRDDKLVKASLGQRLGQRREKGFNPVADVLSPVVLLDQLNDLWRLGGVDLGARGSPAWAIAHCATNST